MPATARTRIGLPPSAWRAKGGVNQAHMGSRGARGEPEAGLEGGIGGRNAGCEEAGSQECTQGAAHGQCVRKDLAAFHGGVPGGSAKRDGGEYEVSCARAGPRDEDPGAVARVGLTKNKSRKRRRGRSTRMHASAHNPKDVCEEEGGRERRD